MHEYDLIAAGYAADRSPVVGVAAVRAFVAGLPPGARVLDVGCGTGLPLTRALVDAGLEVVGVDSSARMLDLLHASCPTVRTHRSPIESLPPLPEAPFAAILAWGVLFHLDHAAQTAALARFASLLAPGGRLLFTAGDEHGTIEGAPMHGVPFRYWSFDREGYRALLATHGLTLDAVSTDATGNIVYRATRG